MNLKLLMSTAALAVGLGGAALAQDEDTTKVGFVYVGPIGDGGWTATHERGRQEVMEHFGDQVETVYSESVPEGPDAERVMQQMALNGADIIFATSFGYMEPVLNVAEDFPDVNFEHATGYKTAENAAVYNARFYEGRAVQGTIAGHMTESNTIGYIGSVPIPEVIRGINSAFIHARKVNPDVEFKIVWINSWFDPAKEADAAQSLIDQGADVILQHTDSTAPLAAAAEAEGDVYGFGQASDMSEFAPAPRISANIDNWGPYYIERVQAVMDGTWETGSTWGGIGDGFVGVGEISSAVPDDVKQEALDLKDRIASGDYHPFTGPVNKQDGSAWLAEGETATDETLLGMNFYVEGIEGDIPQ